VSTSVLLHRAAAEDRRAIVALLESAALPVDGIDDAAFVVAERAGVIVGCAAIERRGTAGLLRSVAVDAACRGIGIGDALVAHVIKAASRESIDPIVLLTTTAAEWFARYAFTRIAQSDVPAPLLASAEFQGACPASAVIMRRALAAEDAARG
jgi:amino-acid N-acetyltransferase